MRSRSRTPLGDRIRKFSAHDRRHRKQGKSSKVSPEQLLASILGEIMPRSGGGQSMREDILKDLVALREGLPVWDRVFTVSPLVVVGTKEEGGEYDLAPKHMAMPMGWENYFGFVCTPRHRTYHNARREGVFTVSYPRPAQVILASLAAAPRESGSLKKP